MKFPDQSTVFVETTVDGPRTRRWLLERGECGELGLHRIARLGIEEAFAPYCRVRTRPAGSFFLATTDGEGRILLDGKWQKVTPGSLFMAPPRVLNAFYASPGKKWRFAWLRYDEPGHVRALVGADSPVRAAGGGRDLAAAIAGVHAEWTTTRDPKVLHHWTSLVQAFAVRSAHPTAPDDRLAILWARIGSELDTNWNLEKLASLFHGSAESLRRRCRSELGRTPMQHLAYMRMERARSLLESTRETLDSIASQVGYLDGLSFSRAFTHWTGVSPREYRARR